MMSEEIALFGAHLLIMTARDNYGNDVCLLNSAVLTVHVVSVGVWTKFKQHHGIYIRWTDI